MKETLKANPPFEIRVEDHVFSVIRYSAASAGANFTEPSLGRFTGDSLSIENSFESQLKINSLQAPIIFNIHG